MDSYLLKVLKTANYKFVLAILFLALGFNGPLLAQERNAQLDQKLRDLVTKEALFAEDAAYVITSQHTSKISGTHHIYFVQAINGIPVKGTESSIHVNRDGRVSNFNNFLVKNLANQAQNLSGASLTAQMAIQSVANKMVYNLTGSLTKIEQKSNGITVYSKAGISERDIPTQLSYYYRGKEGLSLTWELSIAELRSADWWNFFVDASTGEIVDKYNFTNYCDLGHDHSNDLPFIGPMPKPKSTNEVVKTVVVNEFAPVPAQYRVFAMPDESPNHSSGRVLVVNPENTNASPHGWHDTNNTTGAEFTTARGNNVFAYEDGDNAGFTPNGGSSLDFDYALTIPYTSGNQSESAAITNLFYWNNIIHDVLYEYGFDEASGNFQENNYGNSGAAGDSVNAEAQDGSGTCNANFSTPSDGGNPRMQMYVCNFNNDDGVGTFADGDFDNLVIVHEYGHGVSNRLTGGPAAAGCLGNTEQMGEGWSDYLGLMLTMKASDVSSTNRPVGTFLFEEPTTGGGIRPQPYNRENNTQTYSNISSVSVPHGVGSVWATMLWEMTWDLIDVYGFDADFYAGTGGNNIALQLVMEGMKLQPCSPGFVDGRDAILQADTNLYGGANQCLIWDAFARRGLGINANQGSTSSVTDGVQDFTSPSASFSLTGGDTFCVTEGVQTLGGGFSLSPGVYSGSGVTDNGDGTFDFDPATAGVGVATVTYTANNCDGSPAAPTETINVTDGNPVVLCQDATITLDGGGNATLLEADVIGNLTPATGYTIDQTGTFAPEDISAVDTEVTLGDDAGVAVPVGFNFSFFGADYATVYIASNGYLTFTNAGLNQYINTAMGNGATPNNAIMAMWDDLRPDAGSTISYATIGSSPNRVFIANFDNVRHWTSGGTGVQNTFQVKMFEGTGVVEIHGTNITSDGGTRTQGIENTDASEFYAVTGRNSTTWTATNDFVAFIPNAGGLAENCGNSVAVSFSQTDFTCANLGDNIVTITADDGAGGITTCDVTVTVEGTGSTFSGGSWDVAPTLGSIAVFSDNFDTTTDGDVVACSCDIEAGNTVTVNAGGTLAFQGNINVNGVLDIEHEGSVVQLSANPAVNNNGSIFVRKTTSTLNNRDFMIVGNPMTGSTRANTFPTAIQLRNHLTANFAPNTEVAAFDPGVENWADDNGDNWANYTGLLNPAEGYLIMPQASPTVPDGATYDFVYDDGTLNTGTITYTALFNASQNDSPNIVANPYASAIGAETFIDNNSGIVGTLYFWDHLNSPATGYPGYNESNYDMGDISMFVGGSGGVAAANGGTAPTGFIASGQGFGFKALAAGEVSFLNTQRVFGNNTDYRSTEILRDRIWLNVRNEAHQLGSQMLVAFVEGATQEFESGYDAKRLATPVSLFSTLITGEQLTIQGREAFDIESQVVLGFRSQIEENQLFTISIDNIERALMSEDVNVYLEDKVTGTITNLSERNYSFMSNAVTAVDRFNMFFQEKVLSTDSNLLNTLSVVPNPTSGIITILAPQTTVNYIEVIDVRGRIIAQKQYNAAGGNGYELDLTLAESAMYFVKIHTPEGTITKRLLKQ